jgi:hypothetical protein
VILLTALLLLTSPAAATPWPATDGLGRSLPTFRDVGPVRTNRQVALFYFLWLNQHSTSGPHTISHILQDHPEARENAAHPAWGPIGHYHHFAEPLFGYYRSTDEWVYRKHAELLADAGVDAIIFDCSNAYTYRDSYFALCRAFDQARKDGVAVPRIAFLCRFGPYPEEVEEIYNDLYQPGLYPELWFYWKGKPLILAYPEGTSAEIRQFFTFRPPMPTYFDPPSRNDQWGWLQCYPQHPFGGTATQPEQMPVGVAMNAVSNTLSAFSHPQSMGRSYHRGHTDPRPHAYRYGLNFQEQWDSALAADPELIIITGWNEWVAMRMNEFNGYRAPVVFVDQFDVEHSRDIEPMRGGYQDHYYYQMVANIRRFKGMAEPATTATRQTMSIDGDLAEWREVEPVFADYRGDTRHRDFPGWGDHLHYTNRLGRNDILRSKVSHDDTNLYFYVQTTAQLSDPGHAGWMQLLIDADRSHTTGWAGYDVVVNRQPPDAAARLEAYVEADQWTPVTNLAYRVNGAELEIAVPRRALPVPADRPLDIEFKWVDHPGRFGDVMDFYTCGDAAPGGRFNYHYRERVP